MQSKQEHVRNVRARNSLFSKWAHSNNSKMHCNIIWSVYNESEKLGSFFPLFFIFIFICSDFTNRTKFKFFSVFIHNPLWFSSDSGIYTLDCANYKKLFVALSSIQRKWKTKWNVRKYFCDFILIEINGKYSIHIDMMIDIIIFFFISSPNATVICLFWW